MWNKPKILNWCANLLFSVAVVMMLYGALFVLVHLPIFPVNEVRVEGKLKHINQEQVRLIVGKYLKGNFYTLDLQRTRDAFEKLPWARKVSVRRKWPDKIVVTIEEHQAIARWGNIAMVNQGGELFQAASDEALPIFYGPSNGVKEVTKGYFTFSKMLAEMNLSIQQVSLSSRRAWEITTADNKKIALGREDMQTRLRRFIQAYQSESYIKSEDWQYADLRYPNGFSLKKMRLNNNVAPT